MAIGIIGLGLIGGSAAMAVKRAGGEAVYGMDADAAVLERALAAGAIDAYLAPALLPDIDVLIAAVYPDAAIEAVKKCAPSLKQGAIVVDFCGVKRHVAAALVPLARQSGFVYVGGHPMAGKEKSGFDFAGPELFAGASMILCPEEDAPREALARLESLFASMGFGGVVYATPEEHDRIIAYTSQLAHVLSSAYVKAPAALRYRGFSAGSFRDMTRVAWLNEKMWTELFLENADFLAGEVEDLAARLMTYADAIRAGDAHRLEDLLREGRLRKEEVDG